MYQMETGNVAGVALSETRTKSPDGVVTSDNPETKQNQVDIRATSWEMCCLTSMLPFAIYYGFVNITTSALAVYLVSQTTTIEKQFGLSSSQIGVLLGMNDVGYLTMVIFASYFGRNSHIPRVLSVCCCLYGVSALICAAPHFITNYSLDSLSSLNASTNFSSTDEGRLCSTSSLPPDTGECTSDQKNFYSGAKTVAIALISSGMLLQGMTKAPSFPLLGTYIDDNVPKTKSGFYIGIVNTVGIIGPAVSFGLGGVISRLYVTLEETTLTPRDPRWIGAWWLGFLVVGSLAIALSLPICLFPRKLANAPQENNPGTSPSGEHRQGSLTQRAALSIKGILPAMLCLAKNPVYVLFTIGTSIRAFVLYSEVAFGPKYMQIYYGLSIFKSNIIVGFGAVGFGAASTFLSGVLTRKLKLGLGGCLKAVCITQGVDCLLLAIGVVLVCPQGEIQQFDINNQSYPFTVFSTGNSSPCYAGCHCDAAKFFPICGADGANYISPCHAGCMDKGPKGYMDCLCISNATADPLNHQAVDATPGLCESECSLHNVFTVLLFLTTFVSGSGAIPTVMVPIRATESKDKSLAIGISAFFRAIIGFLIAPIIIGYIIDTSCRLWNTSCSRAGSCDLYDVMDYRLKYHGLSAGGGVVYMLFYVLTYVSFVRGGGEKAFGEKIQRSE
ncbi:solute carrier organic anion transporter family member 1C1-like [Liolophura sinensis]|uniref:solute carrier organic anion transporter family member 1C1-like n=1 Tax=Liolophura sinensis TaxID=3198878 RepID=UPI00315805DA